MADNNIALGVKQPEPVNYLGQMAQVMAIKVAQQEMQGNDQMRAAYGDGSGDWSDPAFRQKMYTANPTKAAAMEEKAAKTKQDQLAGAKAQLGLRGQLAGGLIADPTFDNFQRVLAQGVQYGLGSQKDAEAELLRIGNDPAKIKKWAEDHQRGALDAEKQLPKLETKDFGGTVGVLSIDPVTGQAKQTYTQNKTQSPDSAASVGATIRGQNMTDALGRERLNAETAPLNLSPEALDAAAAVFNATGRLPPVGVGKRAAQSKVDIMTRAGQLAGGPTNNLNPTEAPPNVNNLNGAAPPVAAPGGAPVAVAPPVAAAPAAVTKSVPEASNAGGDIGKTLDAWAAAWSKKNVKAYLAFYAKNFQTPSGSRAAWEAERNKRINKPGSIQVSIENLKVSQESADRATVRFRQHYRSASLKSSSNKVLVLVRHEGKWLIQQERVGK